MNIAVLIPDRGDRPEFLKNCLRMVGRQTHQPSEVLVFDDPPISDKCDITWRYRLGYERLRGKHDLIAFIENDDWYCDHYLETMADQWVKHGEPDLIGTSYTIYYHLKLNAFYTMDHRHRSSAMSTLVRGDIQMTWPDDADPYADLHIWRNIGGVVFTPDHIICMGMKHGIGKCGGKSHIDRLNRYREKDGLRLLEENLDAESLEFYTNVYNKLQS